MIRSATPAGLVATITHFGPYDRLFEAYDARFAFCAESNRVRSGPFWEVYGHWTDVFFVDRLDR